jgi:hypothetical protein
MPSHVRDTIVVRIGQAALNTDITVPLGTMGTINPLILNASQWGDAATTELFLAQAATHDHGAGEPGKLDQRRQARRDPVLRRRQRHRGRPVPHLSRPT